MINDIRLRAIAPGTTADRAQTCRLLARGAERKLAYTQLLEFALLKTLPQAGLPKELQDRLKDLEDDHLLQGDEEVQMLQVLAQHLRQNNSPWLLATLVVRRLSPPPPSRVGRPYSCFFFL